MGREECAFVQKGRESGPRYAEDLRGGSYRLPKRLDDLSAGMARVFHVNPLVDFITDLPRDA